MKMVDKIPLEFLWINVPSNAALQITTPGKLKFFDEIKK